MGGMYSHHQDTSVSCSMHTLSEVENSAMAEGTASPSPNEGSLLAAHSSMEASVVALACSTPQSRLVWIPSTCVY